MSYNENNLDIKIKEAQSTLRIHYSNISDVRYDFRNSSLYQLIITYLKGHTVLDVGCGPGHFVCLAQEYGYSVVGVESDINIIKLVEDIYPGFKFDIRCGTAENIDLEKPVDTIVMLDVLEHIKDEGHTLSHLSNFLVDSGRMVIVVPSHPWLYGIRDRSIGHYRRYSKRQIIKLINNSGMRVLKIRHWNALGVIPFFLSEKIFKRPIQAKIRSRNQQKSLKSYLAKLLSVWFKFIENRFDFRFGLSLICIAETINEKNSETLL